MRGPRRPSKPGAADSMLENDLAPGQLQRPPRARAGTGFAAPGKNVTMDRTTAWAAQRRPLRCW